jgi:hypothetical protein
MNEGLPCRNIIGCWKERTDVISFLRKNFSDEDLKKVFSGPHKTRLGRIVEFLEKPD